MSVTRTCSVALLIALSVPVAAPAQAEPQPLHKTDLIRLLTDSTLTPTLVADQVQQRCLAFVPTA
ncbi:MAG TPA: hypothetical protein VKO86_08495, partial [Gemmatimonadales bacterium]|nr:hypothetical protein [Gemmatimonadales bacterium]